MIQVMLNRFQTRALLWDTVIAFEEAALVGGRLEGYV